MEGEKYYNYGWEGHIATRYPHNALFCAIENESQRSLGIFWHGYVEGKETTSILMDTGCSRTMV